MCPSPGTSRSTLGSSITLMFMSLVCGRKQEYPENPARRPCKCHIQSPSARTKASTSPQRCDHPPNALLLQTLSSSRRSPPPDALLCDSHQVSALGVNAVITLVSIHFPFSVSCTEAFHPFPFPAPRVRISPCLDAKSIIDSAQLPPFPPSVPCDLRRVSGHWRLGLRLLLWGPVWWTGCRAELLNTQTSHQQKVH